MGVRGSGLKYKEIDLNSCLDIEQVVNSRTHYLGRQWTLQGFEAKDISEGHVSEVIF